MKIVTAQITEIKKHPKANKLQICQVTTGEKQFEVICGATNAREQMITVLAMVGSQTPKGLKIEVSDLRGIESHGMLCSPTDLNIKNEKGIIDLPADTKLGVEFTTLPTTELSSTPWHQYKLVEQLVETKPQTFSTVRSEFSENKKNVISETYWHDGQYHYRHF